MKNKPDPKEYIFYNSIYVKLKNRQTLSMMIEVRIVVTFKCWRHERPRGLIFKMWVGTLFLNPEDVTQNYQLENFPSSVDSCLCMCALQKQILAWPSIIHSLFSLSLELYLHQK